MQRASGKFFKLVLEVQVSPTLPTYVGDGRMARHVTVNHDTRVQFRSSTNVRKVSSYEFRVSSSADFNSKPETPNAKRSFGTVAER